MARTRRGRGNFCHCSWCMEMTGRNRLLRLRKGLVRRDTQERVAEALTQPEPRQVRQQRDHG